MAEQSSTISEVQLASELDVSDDLGVSTLSQYELDIGEVLSLITHFLDRGLGLRDCAKAIQNDPATSRFFGPTVGWNGDVHEGRAPDGRGLRGLASDHLLRLLTALRPSPIAPPSRLSFLAYSAEAVIAAEVRKHLASKISKNGNTVQQLIDLRLQQRQLLRETKSSRGRSGNFLSSSLRNVTNAIRPLLVDLAYMPRIRRLSGRNVLDHISSEARETECSLQFEYASKIALLRKIVGHRAPAYCTVASHSKYIVTGADDNLVKVWDGQTGYLKAALRGHRNVVTDLAVTEELIVSGSDDNTVRIWEIGTSRSLCVLQIHKEPVQRVRVSADDKLLFTCADDGACCVWSLDLIKRQVADRDATTKAWITREKDRRRHDAMSRIAQPDPGSDSTSVAVVDDLQLLAEAPRITLLQEAPLVFPHCDAQGDVVRISSMAVHPTGQFVVTGTEDHLARVWSVAEVTAVPPPIKAQTRPDLIYGDYVDGADHLLCVLSGHSDGFVQHVEWSHRGDKILTFSDKDGTARVWFWPLGDMASRPHCITMRVLPATQLSGRSNAKLMPQIVSAGFSANDSYVVTSQSVNPSVFKGEEPGFYDSRICVWDSRSGSLLHAMRGHRTHATLFMHPSIHFLGVSCGTDGMIIFWDVLRGEEIKRIEVLSTEGTQAILDGSWAVTSSCHGADFVATDAMGRLILLGTGSASSYAAAYCEQFFQSECNDFILDDRTGEPLDASQQIPLHLVNQPPILVDKQEGKYAEQPPYPKPGEGSLIQFTDLRGSNHKSRMLLTRQQQRVLADRELAARQCDHIDSLLTSMDADIEKARRLDAKRMSEVKTKIVVENAPKGSGERQSEIRTRPRRSATSEVSYTLGVDELDALDEVEGDGDLAVESGNGRSRRAAARRANARIHRIGQYMESSVAPPSHGTRGPSRGDGDDASGDNAMSSGDDASDQETAESNSESESDQDDEDVYRDGARHRSRGRARKRNGERRYETRGVRPNYVELDEGRGSASRRGSSRRDEANDDEHRPAGVIRRQRRTLRSTVNAIAESYSDDWLRVTEGGHSYVAQVGDLVAYFAQGHQEYLRHFPSAEPPPWLSWNAKEWPFVIARVDSVKYEFPPKDVPQLILCRVDVTVTGVKAPQDCNSLYIPYPSDQPALGFSFVYHPFDQGFVVLLARVEAGLKLKCRPGLRVQFVVGGSNDSQNDWITTGERVTETTIKEIAVKDENNWPDSPWEALVCETEPEGSVLHLSPWDINAEISLAATTTTTTTSSSITTNPVFAPLLIVGQNVLEWRETIIGGKDVQSWIADELESSPLWPMMSRIRRHPNIPCFVSSEIVYTRLRSKTYYRQLEAIEEDFRKIIESATFMKQDNHPVVTKAKRFETDLIDIISFVRLGEDSEAARQPSADCDTLRDTLLEALSEVAAADKEGFFESPVDLEQFEDYNEYVSTPMDFSTIRQQILNEQLGRRSVSLARARRFVRNVVGSVRLVGENAMVYNLPDTLAFRRGKEVLRKLAEVFANIDVENLHPIPEQRRLRSAVNDMATSTSRNLQRRTSVQDKGFPQINGASSSGRALRSSARTTNDADSLLYDEVNEPMDPEERILRNMRSTRRRESRLSGAIGHRTQVVEPKPDEELSSEDEKMPIPKDRRVSQANIPGNEEVSSKRLRQADEHNPRSRFAEDRGRYPSRIRQTTNGNILGHSSESPTRLSTRRNGQASKEAAESVAESKVVFTGRATRSKRHATDVSKGIAPFEHCPVDVLSRGRVSTTTISPDTAGPESTSRRMRRGRVQPISRMDVLDPEGGLFENSTRIELPDQNSEFQQVSLAGRPLRRAKIEAIASQFRAEVETIDELSSSSGDFDDEEFGRRRRPQRRRRG